MKNIERRVRPSKHDWPIKIVRTEDEGASWSFTAASREAADQFLKVAQLAIATPTSSDTSDAYGAWGLLAARLVCLDGIRPNSLALIDASTTTPYRLQDSAAIDWEEANPKRVERRLLSHLTLRAWKAVAESTGEAVSAEVLFPLASKVREPGAPYGLQQALKRWLTTSGFYIGQQDQLAQLSADQACWLAEVLPGTLFAHSANAFHMSGLPRSTWARLETKRALAHVEANDDTGDTGETATDRMADLICEVAGTTVNENLLQISLDVLGHTHSSSIDGLTKRLWISELEKLPFNLSTTNPQTIVLVGWLIHMCESGTVTKGNASVGTIRAYAQRSILKLARRLAAVEVFHDEPEDWPSSRLWSLYREVIDDSPSGSRSVVAAALASFQRYLEDLFDVESLPGPISSGTQSYIPAVRSDILWPHEIDWCMRSCLTAQDQRVGEIARVMLSIARECAVRHQDLSRLTLRNVAFDQDAGGGYCELEIARNARRGRLKTENAQRRLIVKAPSSIELIKAWTVTRTSEGAPLESFLFGDPTDDSMRYRPTAVHAYMNRLVKVASGCPTMCFHSLRHTVLSQKVEEALSSVSTVDTNPLEVIAAEAGHASPLTTLRTYSHIYEAPLRMWLDQGFRDHLVLSSSQMAIALSELSSSAKPIPANTVVQAARRNSSSLQAYWWRCLERAPLPVELTDISQSFSWDDAVAPLTGSRKISGIAITGVADALMRLSQGASTSSVARILNVPEDRLRHMQTQLQQWLWELHRGHFPRSSRRIVPLPSMLKLLMDMHINFKGTQLPMWTRLSSKLDQGISPGILNGSIRYWSECGRGIYLPLLPTEKVRPLITLLRLCDVDRDHIRAVVQNPKPASSSTRREPALPADIEEPVADSHSRREVARLFEEEMRIEPRFEMTRWRCDRPMAYLQINPHADSERPAGRSEQSGSLKAWLVAIEAHRFLTAEGSAHD